MLYEYTTDACFVKVETIGELTYRVHVTGLDRFPVLSGVLVREEAETLVEALTRALDETTECGLYADPRRERPLADPVCHQHRNHSGTHVGIGLDGSSTGFHFGISELAYRRQLEG